MSKHSIWQGRRVLLTGHTGFKGSWLALWLQHLGAEVVGYALQPPEGPNLFQLAGVDQGMTSIVADVRDAARVLEVCQRHQPEVVFHLAAQSLVRPSYEQPVETYATNVMGTVHLLEAIRHTSSVRAALMVTSDKCYENREWLWPYRENEAMGGHDPYSSSKGCAELVTAAYRSSYFSPAPGTQHGSTQHGSTQHGSTQHGTTKAAIASARAGNVIGGGDWGVDRLIPDLVRGIVAGETIHIRSPHAIRPWQHVLEALRGYLDLAERLWSDGQPFAEGWNFGPDDGDAKPVGWIVERLTDRWLAATGEPVPWTRDEGDHPHEAGTLKLDSAKARTRLGWQPRLDLATCLDWIIEWTRRYQARENPRDITLEQIQRYEELAHSSTRR